ncbi:SOS response-associated peptidase family protein [Caulobacter sp. S45]|uniref:SOS response-associated peptidase family protein n=1 Tax=Caulobacter sp. S45 TaxID=1641861 RepID=UPI00131BB336|nr:SOS response-associated peptidase family protein [Caulobacter sp. S45]
MCNETAQRKAFETLMEDLAKRRMPSFEWSEGRIPNDLGPKESIRISDSAPIVRLRGDKLVGSMTPWAWKGPTSAPVFNYVTEKKKGERELCDFSKSDRVLVFADGFYEYTTPKMPKVKLKDRHLFEMKDEPWFWIAGIVKQGCYTLLTTEPGPDLKPYHDRQIVTFAPDAGLDWLTFAQPPETMLKAPLAGTFKVTPLRKDGVDLAA